MIHQMSARERILASMVGVVAFLFLNFFVIDYFLKNQRRLKGDLTRSAGAIATMKLQVAEKPMWEERQAFFQANLPKLAAEDRAGLELLDQVTQLARNKSVQIVSQSQNLGVATYQPEYTSVSVQVDITSTWPALLAFLHELQGPKKFIVFESANLKRDDKDDTQMRGSFKIARWFAPKPK